ncbi:MAG: hypothetical protein ACM3PE_10045 [Deltaproteobacteria bacterium]
MFSNASARVERWRLTNHTCLEDILPLLDKEYQENVDGTSVSLFYKWMPYNSDNKIIEININDKNVRYFPVKAQVDYLSVSKAYLSQVPRDVAVRTIPAEFLFVEIDNTIWVMVSTSKTSFGRVRSKLFKGADKKVWGELDFKPVKLDKSFFYWLMSKVKTELQLGDENYILIDCDKVTSHSEREQNDFIGQGQGILERAPIEAMISCHNLFSEIGIKLKNETEVIVFKIDELLVTEIDTTLSHRTSNNQITFYSPIELVLKIYLKIIPKLIQAFNNELDWGIKEEAFRKQTAVKAIQKMLVEAGISVTDLGA